MAYSFSTVEDRVYKAKDPGCRLKRDSVGTKFLTYILENKGCSVTNAVKYATNRDSIHTHYPMVRAFRNNDLFQEYKTQGGVYLTHKGLYYLANALLRD